MKEGPFEVGNQVLISSRRKLLWSKASRRCRRWEGVLTPRRLSQNLHLEFVQTTSGARRLATEGGFETRPSIEIE